MVFKLFIRIFIILLLLIEGLYFVFFKVKTSPLLTYYGYFLADNTGLPGHAGNPEFIDEMFKLGNTNMVEIQAQLDKTFMDNYLVKIKKNNYKTIIDMTWIFFSKTGNDGKGAILYSNWQERWKEFLSLIKPYENNIYAFYYDEPYWQGINLLQFRLVSKATKDYSNKIKNFVIEAQPVIDQDKITPYYLEYITDYSFDYYFYTYKLDSNTFIKDWNKLKIIARDKTLWLSADGFVSNKNDIISLIDANNYYYDLAVREGNVKGILFFVYSDNIPEFPYTLRNILDSHSEFYNKDLLNSHLYLGKNIIKLNRY